MPPAETWDRATRAPAPSDRAGRRGFDGQRCLDLGLTLLALPLALPLIGLAALAVKLDSPGPAFFRQQRLGQAGRPFELVKLRTMRAESDPSLHRAHVRALLRSDAAPGTWRRLSADPRVTRVGAWLRATGIDELPQLGNVLRGEMSLVGPRPLLMEYLPRYNAAQGGLRGARAGRHGYAARGAGGPCGQGSGGLYADADGDRPFARDGGPWRRRGRAGHSG